MPYEVEPEHNLSDLSEVEVYERVLQLAADRQLIPGAPDLIGEVDIKLFSLESKVDHPQESALSKESSKIHQNDLQTAILTSPHGEICPAVRRALKERLCWPGSEPWRPTGLENPGPDDRLARVGRLGQYARLDQRYKSLHDRVTVNTRAREQRRSQEWWDNLTRDCLPPPAFPGRAVYKSFETATKCRVCYAFRELQTLAFALIHLALIEDTIGGSIRRRISTNYTLFLGPLNGKFSELWKMLKYTWWRNRATSFRGLERC
ncbi:hypothetical protein BKA61DRAFT_582315 [Leptodontidium sp. MPI-SDFR-AT-0119]|nr:hypothetical protein BKA61DRAFT_582315 [Leptodontidium sp. MPI-SDFR-AT-0119]